MTSAKARSKQARHTSTRPAPASKAPRHGTSNGEAHRAQGLGVERQPLHRCVTEALATYFSELDGEEAVGLYEMVVSEVERPLLESVMRQVCGNQTRAADMLGLNRGTLRKKLKQHGLLEP